MARRTSSCPTTGSLGRLRAASCRPTPFARCATGCLSGEKSENLFARDGAHALRTQPAGIHRLAEAQSETSSGIALATGDDEAATQGKVRAAALVGAHVHVHTFALGAAPHLAHALLAQVVAAGPGRMTSAGEVVPVGISAGARNPTTDSRARR